MSEDSKPNTIEGETAFKSFGKRDRWHEEYLNASQDASSFAAQVNQLSAENARLRAALQSLVADVDEYEWVNRLAPNPGKLECWQSMARARAALAKAKGEV